jgi:hypothetical protein
MDCSHNAPGRENTESALDAFGPSDVDGHVIIALVECVVDNGCRNVGVLLTESRIVDRDLSFVHAVNRQFELLAQPQVFPLELAVGFLEVKVLGNVVADFQNAGIYGAGCREHLHLRKFARGEIRVQRNALQGSEYKKNTESQIKSVQIAHATKIVR